MNQPTDRLSRLHPVVVPAVVFGFALVVRLLVFFQVSRDIEINKPVGDGLAYLRWAAAISQDGWIGSQVFYQTPLYPYFLAVVRSLLGPELMQIWVLQAVLGAGSCALMALGAARLFNPAVGLIAGLMLAFYAPIISFDLQIDKVVFDPLLTTALIACVANVNRKPTARGFLGCGVLSGLAAINRENAIILLLVLIPWCMWLSRGMEIKRRGKWMGALVGGVVCVVMPISLRNSLIGKEFHLVTSQFGPNFYIGNSAEADGIYRPLKPDRGDAQYERIDATELAEQAMGHSLSPGGVSRYWARRAFADIKADPVRWFRLLGRKVALTLTNTELADSHTHDRYVVWSPVLNVLDSIWGFGVVFGLAAVGFVLAWDIRAQWWPVAMMALVYLPAVAIFYVFARYRITLVVLLIPFAAAAIVRLPMLAKHRRIIVPASAAGAIALSLVWLGRLAEPDRIKGTTWFNRGNMAVERQQTDRAIRLYEQAIVENPSIAFAHRNLGRLLTEKQEFTRATEQLIRATQLAPNDPPAHVDLGVVLARQRQFDGAAEQFEAALRLDPHLASARFNLGLAYVELGKHQEAVEVLRPMASANSSDLMARQAAAIIAGINNPTTRTQ